MKPPLLLCYNLPDSKASQIRLIAMRYRIRVRFVQEGELEQPLGALCGLEVPSEPTPAEEAFQDEMLLMAFFTEALMNQFLQALRKAKLPPVPLKAILTDTNAAWSSGYLHSQLAAEREAIEAGQQPAHPQKEN